MPVESEAFDIATASSDWRYDDLRRTPSAEHMSSSFHFVRMNAGGYRSHPSGICGLCTLLRPRRRLHSDSLGTGIRDQSMLVLLHEIRALRSQSIRKHAHRKSPG